MYKIRKIKYSKGSTSVQVYTIENRKRVIVLHIATNRTESELGDLIHLAHDFIRKAGKQLVLFDRERSHPIVDIDRMEFLGVHHGFVHEAIHKPMIPIGFDKLRQELL